MSKIISIKKLCHQQCANYDDYYDCCLISNKKCSQSCSTDLICPYFTEAILPLDPVLEKQLTANKNQVGQKRCSLCNKTFIPNSNRQKYCSKCRDAATRKRHAKFMRNQRQPA